MAMVFQLGDSRLPSPRRAARVSHAFPSVPTDPSCDASDFGAPFGFAGGEWRFSPCRALWWGEEQALVVADLHLEKASWYAQRGQFLPPTTAAKRWSA
jgi:hypothetical protein